MHYAVRSRRRVRPWAAALAVLAVVLSLGLTVAGAANGAAAQGDRARPTAERTGAPPGPATVTYVLTGALGQPLPAVRVVIHDAPDWIWMDEGVTDSAGRVTFANIPAGSVGAQGQGTLSNVDLGTTTLVAGSQTVAFEMATSHGEVSGRLANLVVLDAPAELAPMPPAVEIAAYRIVTEAVTNVARHAVGVTRCTVSVRAAQHLVLLVGDDGPGVQAGPGAGVGLASMRARAEELGGSCEISGTPEGTTVRVVLPLSASPRAAQPRTSRDVVPVDGPRIG